MRLVVTFDSRFLRVDGRIYSPNATYDNYWVRYTRVFPEVLAVTRVIDAETIPEGWGLADGPGVTFKPVRNFDGLGGYVKNYFHLRKEIDEVLALGDAYVLKVPGQLGGLAWRTLRRQGKPFGLEVMADPWDAFARGSYRHPLRPLIRRRLSRELRAMCREAVAASYVTGETLQKLYPCPGWTTHASSVTLKPESIVTREALDQRIDRYRHSFSAEEPKHIVHIGSMNSHYKRQDVLIEAISRCREKGLDVRACLIGEGQHRQEFQDLAARLGVSAYVTFMGWVPSGEAIWEALDKADLFVLTSMAEGLPRVVIEAMARGLPCISTPAGGVSEIMDASELVPKADPNTTADRICELLGAPERMAALSLANWEQSQDYREEPLQARRDQLYTKVAEASAARKVGA